MREKQLYIDSSERMEELGFNIGNKIVDKICIELSSDLGGGKTTFTRGFVRGLGSFDNVASPTFTIGKQYKSNKFTCYHFDFYRLQEPGLVAEELNDALSDPQGAVVIEWADTVSGVLPTNRIIIKIERDSEDSEARKCLILYSDKHRKIVEDL
jgi:tRNA threonylcarbamoyladenosine biosynthesis protein TsaE